MGSYNDTFYQPARETLRQLISLNYLKFRLEQLPVCQWLAIAGVCHRRPCICICTWQSVLTSFPLPARTVLPCSVYLVDLKCLVISLWNEKLATWAWSEAHLSSTLWYLALRCLLMDPWSTVRPRRRINGPGTIPPVPTLQIWRRLPHISSWVTPGMTSSSLHSLVWRSEQIREMTSQYIYYYAGLSVEYTKYVGTNLPPSSWN